MDQIQLIGEAIFWSLVGTLFFKSVMYRKVEGTKFFPWLKGQSMDMIRAVIFSVVFIKLGDSAYAILGSYFGIEFPDFVNSAMTDHYKLSHSQLHLTLAIMFNFWSKTRG